MKKKLVVETQLKAELVKNLKTILQHTVFCTVCCDIGDKLIHLDNCLVLEDLEEDAVTLRELLESIFGDTRDLCISNYICEPCKSSVCNTFTFINKTKKTALMVKRYLEQLDNQTTELTSHPIDLEWKNAMIILDDYPEKTKHSHSNEEPYTRRSFVIKHLKSHSTNCPKCKSQPCIHDKYLQAFKNQKKSKLKLNKKPYKCSQCPVCSETEYTHQIHTKTHTKKRLKPTNNSKIKKYKCLMCKKDLKTKLELRAHIKNMHEKKPNLCLYCNKQFDSRQEYLVHVQTAEHRKNIPFAFRHKCSHCDHSANTPDMLKAHVNRVHLHIRPFECEHCHKRYFESTKLKNHMKTHTGQTKQKVCDICGAHLAGPTALKKHRRLHTGENPYSCPYCDVKTICNSSLKTHIMRKHMEPTISCPLCDLKFHTMNNARGHVKKTHWKSKEKFDYTKLKGLAPEDYDFFRDRRKALV